MEVTAPHLTRAVPMVLPLQLGGQPPAGRDGDGAGCTPATCCGARHTPARDAARPRRLSATETLQLAPGLRRAGLRGGLLSWDGQLEDDARLVTTIARTAAANGAHVRTRGRGCCTRPGRR